MNGWLTKLCCAVLVTASAACSAADFAWIEGEKPTSVPVIATSGNPEDKGYEFKGWGNTQFMSEGKVLNISISEKEKDRSFSFQARFTVSVTGRSWLTVVIPVTVTGVDGSGGPRSAGEKTVRKPTPPKARVPPGRLSAPR